MLVVNNLLHREAAQGISRLVSVMLGILTTLLVVSGASIAVRYCRPGRAVMSLAPFTLAAAVGTSVLTSPAPSLVFGLFALGFYTWLWKWIPDAARSHDAKPSATSVAASAAAGSIVTLGFAAAWSPGQPWQHWAAAAVSVVVTGSLSLSGERAKRLVAPLPVRLRRSASWVAGFCWLASIPGMLLTDASVQWCLLAVVPTMAVLIRAAFEGEDDAVPFTDSPIARSISEDPARLLLATFSGLGIGGGLLLWLPVSATDKGVSLLDAVFTAFSASCVTGLAVVDTPTAWTGLGKFVILILIQVGGLGIMAFSTAALALLGRRMSMKHEAAVAQLFSNEDRSRLFGSLRAVLVMTFVSEFVGAIALWPAFATIDGEGVGPALWKAVFTSVSAFCNAGFALNSDSLMSYSGSGWVLGIVGMLITIGGLGPAVVLGVADWRRTRRISASVRLVVMTSAVLVLLPAVLFALLEWNASLGQLGWFDRLTNALFQSVTLRTAGFNSVDFGLLRPVTLVVMMVPMFIGGSPGSTAGGVKTTAFAVVILYVSAALRGQERPVYAGFEIGQSSLNKALAAVALGLMTVGFAFAALALTQDVEFEAALFESISAVATVGLSIGATGSLDSVGKVVIILCMLAGRIGPPTLFLVLTQRRAGAGIRHPGLELSVG
jgi:trk system potassium uptake protein TrkH